MRKLLDRSHGKSPAQAMVEFALALPVLLLIMYGLIESGRLLFIYASVVSAARQAARYGSVTGENAAGTRYYNDCAGIRDAAKKLGFLQNFSDSNIQISYDTGPGTTPLSTTCPVSVTGHPINGDRIRVQVSTDYAPIVPLVPFGHFTITSSGVRTLLVGISVAVDVPGFVPGPGGTGNISLFKDSTPSGYDGPGQTINYSYTVTNLGSDPLVGISMVDDKAGAVDCSGATDPLAGGGNTTCHATYVTTQADVDAGELTNNATVTGTVNGIPAIAYTTLTINFIAKPQLTLVKNGDAPLVISDGELVSYTFALTNSGNVPLTGPYTINDSKVGSAWDCSAATEPLPVGASTACTGTYPLKNQDISQGYVNNTATATAMYGTFTVTSNQASDTVRVPPLFLEVTMSPTTVSAPGQVITYNFKLTNRTWRWQYNLVITDTRGWNKHACGAGYAFPGSYVTCSHTYTVTQADIDAGIVLINRANGDAQGSATSNVVNATVNITQTIQLSLTKTANPTSATTVGTVVNYTYVLKNTGNVTLSAPYAVTDNKQIVNCSTATGTLAPLSTTPTAQKTCTASRTITQADIDAGSIVNTATATAMYGTSTITSPQASATVITYSGMRLGLEKSANPSAFTSDGQLITYTYKLKNTGGVAIPGPFAVTDSKIPSVNCSAAVSPIPVGGYTTCTGTYLTTATDNLLGSVTNIATATANGGALSSTPSPTSLKINKFLCNATTFKHTDPTPIPSGSDILWTLVNNTGADLHINAITINWNSSGGVVLLTQVLFRGATIWGPSNNNTGAFIVPGGPWLLPQGNSVMELKFSVAASNIRIIVSVSEAGCPTVDSSTSVGG